MRHQFNYGAQEWALIYWLTCGANRRAMAWYEMDQIQQPWIWTWNDSMHVYDNIITPAPRMHTVAKSIITYVVYCIVLHLLFISPTHMKLCSATCMQTTEATQRPCCRNCSSSSSSNNMATSATTGTGVNNMIYALVARGTLVCPTQWLVLSTIILRYSYSIWYRCWLIVRLWVSLVTMPLSLASC